MVKHKMKEQIMTRKTNTMLIGLLGTILLGLGTWVLVTIIELQTMVMMSQELMSLDKVIGRIYAHMDRLIQSIMKENLLDVFTDMLSEGVYDPSIFKAFFLAGGSGSGKSYVVRRTTGGFGMKLINPDTNI